MVATIKEIKCGKTLRLPVRVKVLWMVCNFFVSFRWNLEVTPNESGEADASDEAVYKVRDK